MAFSPKHVANCFLQRDFEDGVPTLSPLKLQKLVYFLHGWYLAVTGKPAITLPFQAWRYGPVEESLYHQFKQFGNRPISTYAYDYAGADPTACVVPEHETEFYDVLNAVIEKYGHFNALQLSALTHQKGTPWFQAYRNKLQNIPNDSIRRHFISLVDNHAAA